jgi:REP-associated tyrosine transposase
VARPPRIEIADGAYHVFARGNERRAIYRDANDRTSFLEALALTLERFSWTLPGHCLMTNHYHLVIRTQEPNLAAGMHYLNALYAQRFNRRHGRVGHLFQGRYRATLIQDNERFLAAIRYVVRNPVRAGLCASPQQWAWSSQRAMLGLSPPGIDAVLRLFHPNRQRARELYRTFTHANEGPTVGSHPLIDGDRAFTEVHLGRIRPSREHPKATLRPTPPPIATILPQAASNEQIATAHDAGHTITAIADHLGLNKSTISRRLKQPGTAHHANRPQSPTPTNATLKT